MEILKKYFSILKISGFWEATWKLTRFLLRYILFVYWERDIILRRSLIKEIEDIQTKIHVTIKQATIEDISDLIHFFGKKRCNSFSQRFIDGNICFMACFDGRIVGYSWLNMEPEHDIMKRKIKHPEGENEHYLFDDYVAPEFRHNHIQGAFDIARMRYSKSQECTSVIVNIPNNERYLKSHASRGFEICYFINLYSIFGIKSYKWKNPLRQHIDAT